MTSCGTNDVEHNNQVKQNKTLFYDMDKDFKNFKIMNPNSIQNINGNHVSVLDSLHEFGFGFEFNYEYVKTDSTFNPSVKLKVNKTELNSNFSVVFSCTYTDDSKDIVWHGVPIDAKRIDTTGSWFEINISNILNLPSNTPEDARIAIYTWSADKAKVMVDDFELKW